MSSSRIPDSERVGLPPGVLDYYGPSRSTPVGLRLFQYDKKSLEILKDENLTQEDIPSIPQRFNSDTVSWLIVTGVHNVEMMQDLGTMLKVDPLVLEDILSVNQRPKVEYLKENMAIILRHLNSVEITETLESEQIFMFIGNNYVVTLQESPDFLFTSIMDNIKRGYSLYREKESDFLGYRIFDYIMDHYFAMSQEIEFQVQNIEDEIFDSKNPDPEVMSDVHVLRKNNFWLKRQVVPIMEMVKLFDNPKIPFIHDVTKLYYTDLKDHVLQTYDILDTNRELLISIRESFMAEIGNNLNEIMKTLTVISIIFIPLTFITSLYGMNFKYMPELGWKNGYYFTLTILIGIAAFMTVMFRRWRWI